MPKRSLTLSKVEHNAFIYKLGILHISLSYKADYMNSRKMLLRQKHSSSQHLQQIHEIDDNLLDNIMERDQKYLFEWTVSTGRYRSVSITL